jgi:hypothetical protein
MVCLFAVGVACTNALATDYVWTNAATAGQEWNVAGNWNPNGFPNTASDTAYFGNVDDQDVRRLINQTGYGVTVSAIRVVADTNRYSISVDNWWQGQQLVLQAASDNARIEVVDFGGIDPGSYYGNLRIDTGAGMLRFASDTDIVVTNGTTVYLITPLPLAGSATVNKYGNGIWQVENGDSPFDGVVNVYNGILTLGSNGGVLSNAAAVVAHTGGQITMGTSYSALLNYTTPLVLNGGKIVNEAGERRLRNITVRSTGSTDPGWWTFTCDGVISGTGTFTSGGNGYFNIIGCDIKPGFSTGILNINRTGADFTFASNTLPVTLHIEVNGSGGVPGVNHDQVNVTGLQAGKDVDLANVKVVFSGTGGGAATNWFFTANRMVSDSILASVSNAPGLSSTIVYDYDGKRVGAIVIPEPALLLSLAVGMMLLRVRR